MTNIAQQMISNFINYNIESVTQRLTIPALLNNLVSGIVIYGLKAGLTNGYNLFVEKSVNLGVVDVSVRVSWANSII